MSPMDFEGFLTGRISDRVLDFLTKQHLRATHIVIHNVLESWFQGLLVHQIEVNLVIGRYLNSNVALIE